jgi:hypothetical protein
MARSMTPAQFRSHLQQQANRQRQAINRYNQAVHNHNRKVKTAIDNYNREVRAYNQRLRANQQRVQQAVRQLQSRPVVVTRYVTFRTSVETLHRSYVALDRDQDYAPEMSELLDLSERENANSLDVGGQSLRSDRSFSRSVPAYLLNASFIFSDFPIGAPFAAKPTCPIPRNDSSTSFDA